MATTPTFYIDPKDGRSGGTGSISDPADNFPTPLVTGTVYGLKRGTTLTLSATSNVTIPSVSFVAYGDETLPKPKIDANGNTNVLLLNTTTANHFYAENIHFMGTCTDTVCGVEIQNVLSARLNGCHIVCAGSGGIMINGATANATIENCRIEVATPGKRGIYLLTAPANVTLRNNEIVYTGRAAPTSVNQAIACPAGAGAAIITGNTISGGWYTGIELDSSDGHYVYGNTVSGCTNEGIAMTSSDNNTIECNVIERTSTGSAGSGVIISGSSQDNQTRRNRFDGNHQSYLDTSTGGGNDVIANLFRDANSNHISFQADSTNTAYIMNNTLKHSPTTAGHGFVVQGTFTNAYAYVQNNLTVCDVRGTNRQCIEIAGTITNRILYINSNQYWTENGAVLGSLDNVDTDNFDAWQAVMAGATNVTGDEAQSVFADPGITDWNNPVPRGAAVLGYIGQPMGGRYKDYTGKPFSNPPRPGAFAEAYRAAT